MSTTLLEPSLDLAPPRTWTADDLLVMPDGKNYELVDGALVERKMGMISTWVAGEIHGLLREFNRKQPQAWILPEGTSYQCFPHEPQRLRRADVSVVVFGRLPNEELPRGQARIRPDLAVEVISPHDTFYEVAEKRADWKSAEVPLLWIVDPEQRTVTVYRHGSSNPTELTGEDEITGEDVLRGFRCRISDFFPPRPSTDRPATATETSIPTASAPSNP